jgi:hypothetical protein
LWLLSEAGIVSTHTPAALLGFHELAGEVQRLLLGERGTLEAIEDPVTLPEEDMSSQLRRRARRNVDVLLARDPDSG